MLDYNADLQTALCLTMITVQKLISNEKYLISLEVDSG